MYLLSRSRNPSRRIASDTLYVAAGGMLLTMAPIFNVAAANAQFLDWNDFGIALLIAGVIPGLVVATLALLFPARPQFAVSVAGCIWFSHHHELLAEFLREQGTGNAVALTLIAVILIVPFGFIVLSIVSREALTRITGAVGCALFALAAGSFALAVEIDPRGTTSVNVREFIDPAPLPEPIAAAERLPDIIYIVPDRYGSARVLSADFNLDNSAFLNDLRARGFAVAEQARANYLNTPYSLASTLNMQYLQSLLSELDGKTRRIEPLYELISENLVAARLKQLGYRYIHVGSWWDGTSKSAQADLVVDFNATALGGEFGRAVLRGDPLLLIIYRTLNPISVCELFKKQLSFLEQAGGDDRPVFVFAHVLAPHTPILTDAEGECITPIDYPASGVPDGTAWRTFQAAYAGYVRYINRRFLEIFDRQRAENPNPLVFVLQADEGPYPRSLRDYQRLRRKGTDGASFDWREVSDADLAMKFGIMNALYLGEPSGHRALPEVPETLSPVNNWRLIFARLEGRDYPLLPNRYFIYPTHAQPYHSIEITGHLSGIAR